MLAALPFVFASKSAFEACLLTPRSSWPPHPLPNASRTRRETFAREAVVAIIRAFGVAIREQTDEITWKRPRHSEETQQPVPGN